MKGAYLLVLKLEYGVSIKDRWRLEPGLYVYVGSAMNDLVARVSRHLWKEKKKHWHIDHLLEHARILSVIMIPSELRLEESLSLALSKRFDGPAGFGSSDLKVKTNLYRVDEIGELFKVVSDFLQRGG